MGARTKWLLVVALAIVGILLAWRPLRHAVAVDRCLDAGGSFDYEQSVCDYEVNHSVGDRE